jgi:hypothetical protein
MKSMTVRELITALSHEDQAAEVWATDQFGATESPVTGYQVRDGIATIVLLDFELSEDQ